MLSPEALRYLKRLEIQTRKNINTLFSGQYRSAFRGRGMEFADLREYTYGDDVKALHWKVTARTGIPHIKLFEEERDLQLLIAVDLSGSQYFGSAEKTKNEMAAEVAAFLTWSAGLNNDNVGLVLFTDTVEHVVPPRKGRTHSMRLVRDILNYQPRGRATNIDYAIRYCRRIMRRRGIIFLISDFIADGYARNLAVLAKQHDVIGVMTVDKRELTFPDVGRILIEDAETGALRELDTAPAANRDALAASARRHITATRVQLRRCGVSVIELRTGEPYYQALLDFFRRRQQRRTS